MRCVCVCGCVRRLRRFGHGGSAGWVLCTGWRAHVEHGASALRYAASHAASCATSARLRAHAAVGLRWLSVFARAALALT